MSVYGVTGVSLDEHGMVVEATISDDKPYLMSASDIASKIICGEEYRGVFLDDGRSVLGPKFKAVTLAGGHEGIVLEEDERFTIDDLVRIAHIYGVGVI